MRKLETMDLRFWHRKRLLAVVTITIILTASIIFLLTLKFDYDRENDAVMQHFAYEPGMSDAFASLEALTPPDAVVLCWWDYGRAVMEWSRREVIEAYPSREIADSVGSTQTFWGNLQAQIFAKWGSHEKIQDIARAFMQNEEQSLQILHKYNVSYVLVFVPNELQKFGWIAQIAGYKSTDYLTYNEETQKYEPTAQGEEVTLLRLIFDYVWQPRHFTRLYDNAKSKIYRVDY